MLVSVFLHYLFFFFSSRRRHTRCALVTGVQTCALPIYQRHVIRSTRSVAISADSLHYSGDIAMNLAVIAAIVLAEGTGLTIFDPIFAIGIAAFLITSAARIARHSLDMLMDQIGRAHV